MCSNVLLENVLNATIISLLFEFDSRYDCRSKCSVMVLKFLPISRGLEIALRRAIENVLMLNRVAAGMSCRFKSLPT
jgi:hypothetical protein